MKLAGAVAPLALFAVRAVGVQVQLHEQQGTPGTVKQVVTLLQSLLDDSKKEGDNERDLYTKFKCYCDDNEKLKTQSVEDLTKQIGLLENEVEDIQASSGQLSLQVASLQRDMDANAQARTTAGAMRTKENLAFVAEEADLTAAIDQMRQALDLLSAIGGDQALQASAAHDKFMAGYKPGGAAMLNLQSSVSKALVAASAFLTPEQRGAADSFLQSKAPFTGSYAANSGGVVGILKGMRDTFSSNLESARSTEAAAVQAHTAFMTTKQQEFDTMKGSFDQKQSTLGTNDGDLATKKQLFGTAVQQKADDEEFLATLQDMCSGKAEDYDKRVELRTGEEAALSEAIAILNSDHAFGAFDKVAATKSAAASFLQLAADSRSEARRYLQQQAAAVHSARLTRVAGLLAMGNPFNKVFDSIDSMKAVIAKEAQQDSEQNKWCGDERKTSNDNLQVKEGQITDLNNAISTLGTTINDPETGLVLMIQNDETALEENSKAQSDETGVRRDENKAYQQDVSNCVEAEAVLKKAVKALEAYYKAKDDELKEELGFVQKQAPEPPATWKGEFEGQKEGGNKVLEMLEFILSETAKEESAAHSSEQQAQVAYEDSMAALKTEEAETQKSLAANKKALADTRLELEEKREDLDKTEQEKIAIERYLERIKPGCDFIVDNYATREANRAIETTALDKAVTLLRATPAFGKAKAREVELKQGECAKLCKVSTDGVKCKACLAEVSVPGYCAGHPGTSGC